MNKIQPTLLMLNKQLSKEQSRFMESRFNLYMLMILMIIMKLILFPTILASNIIIMWCVTHALWFAFLQYVSCNERKDWYRYDKFAFLYLSKEKDDKEITEFNKKRYEDAYDADVESMNMADITMRVLITIISITVYLFFFSCGLMLDSLLVPAI